MVSSLLNEPCVTATIAATVADVEEIRTQIKRPAEPSIVSRLFKADSGHFLLCFLQKILQSSCKSKKKQTSEVLLCDERMHITDLMTFLTDCRGRLVLEPTQVLTIKKQVRSFLLPQNLGKLLSTSGGNQSLIIIS